MKECNFIDTKQKIARVFRKANQAMLNDDFIRAGEIMSWLKSTTYWLDILGEKLLADMCREKVRQIVKHFIGK